MFSPVIQKMICGNFSEGVSKRLELHDVDEKSFRQVLNLWCGKDESVEDLFNALALVKVADLFDVVAVKEAVDDMLRRQLRVESCADMLMWGIFFGLDTVEAAALKMLLNHFDNVAKTNAFKRIDENTMCTILDNDHLVVSNEEMALEGLVEWVKGHDGELDLRRLLRSIRFGLMDANYLRKCALLFERKHDRMVQPFVREALKVKSAHESTRQLIHLGPKALNRRLGGGVRWETHADGNEQWLIGHNHQVHTIAFCEDRVYSGSADGMILVSNRATLEQVMTIESTDAVEALVVWEGLLISGHGGGYIGVWSKATGERKWEFLGHDHEIWALKTSGPLLVSASGDGSVKVWEMLAEGPWVCQNILKDGEAAVNALATWDGKVMSGADDGVIRVWDTKTGLLEAKLTGHADWVKALLVHENRLFSASRDGTVRAWALGTWGELGTVNADGNIEERYPCCLAVSGGKLVTGSRGSNDDEPPEIRVYDPATLEYERTLLQPSDVNCLVSVGWEVWGGVGFDLVVWGRDCM